MIPVRLAGDRSQRVLTPVCNTNPLMLFRSSMLEEIKAILAGLLADLPPEAARLNVYRVPKNDGTVIEVVPSNPDAASIAVHVDDGANYVDLSFGERGGTWELPLEGRHKNADKSQLLAEVEEMCRAVVAGHCVKSRGTFWLTSRIDVDGYTYKLTDLPMFGIPFGTRHYAPYVEPPLSK